jgi:hypothetical protein
MLTGERSLVLLCRGGGRQASALEAPQRVHASVGPDRELRANIVVSVPEPSTYAMKALGGPAA